MSYPVSTIEGLGDSVSTGIDFLFPGLAILRGLTKEAPLGGSETGRRALRLFHETMGPSEWTPVVAGVVLGGIAVGAAVLLRKKKRA